MPWRKKNINFWQSLFFSRFFLTFIGLAIIILVSFPLARNIRQQRALNREIKRLKQEIAKVEKRNEGLDKLIAYLQSKQFAEEQARLHLGLKKPGEEVIVIKGVGSTTQSADNIYDLPALNEPQKKMPNWRRWWQYFFRPQTKT